MAATNTPRRRDGTAWPDVSPTAAAVEHWNAATETSRRAGTVLATGLARPNAYASVLDQPFEPMPSFWSDRGDIRLIFRTELLEDHISGDRTIGYIRQGKVSAVCGIGSPAPALRYRHLIAAP